MLRSATAVAVLSLIALGCSASSSGGSGGSGGSTATGTGGSQCHGDQAAWDAIKAAPLDCTKSSDCCVVLNDCLSEARVVPAAKFAEAQDVWPYCDMCAGCIAPVVQVGCSAGTCVGQSLNPDSPEAASQQGSHCGVDPVVVPTPATTPQFDCGGPSSGG